MQFIRRVVVVIATAAVLTAAVPAGAAPAPIAIDSNLGAPATECATFAGYIGFPLTAIVKIDDPPGSAGGVQVSGPPSSISWSSGTAVYAAFIKAGPGGNLYLYPDGAFSDSGLVSPRNSTSHATFCTAVDAPTPPPTSTPVPNTPTPTNTPVPDTPTPTNTPVPDTPTPTNTPVETTVVVPTPTSTATPIATTKPPEVTPTPTSVLPSPSPVESPSPVPAESPSPTASATPPAEESPTAVESPTPGVTPAEQVLPPESPQTPTDTAAPTPTAVAPTPTPQQFVLTGLPTVTPTPSPEVLGKVLRRDALAITGFAGLTIALAGIGLLAAGSIMLTKRRMLNSD